MATKPSIVDLSLNLQHPFAIDTDRIGGVVKQDNRILLVTLGLDGRARNQFELADDFGFPIGVSESMLWLAFSNRIEQRTLDGESVSALEFQFDSPKTRVAAAVFHDNEIIAAIERLEPNEEHGLSEALFRMRKGGEVVWSSLLKVERIEYVGCVEATAKNGFQNLPKPAWKPKQWVTRSRAPILVSGDFVYACWQEFPRSGIGKYYAVRHSDGNPVTATKPYPVSWACSLEDGRILIAAEGYGACWTLRMDPPGRRTGTAEQAWSTHGRVIPMPNGELFCVEMFAGTSKDAHVVRLLPDGTKEAIGAPLPGYHTSAPLPLGDNSFVFWRGGFVWACDPKTNRLEKLASTGDGVRDHSEAVRLADGRVAIFVYPNAKGSAVATCNCIVIQPD